MVDIHCHILPEFDDGSKSKTMSIQMCEMAVQSGITDIIATPHMTDLYAQDKFFERARVRMEYMRNKLESENIPLRLHMGAEVYASNDILYAPDLSKLTLAGSKYLLVEFSFGEATENFVSEVVDAIKEQGLVPVIAHPERYDFTMKNYQSVNNLSEKGVLFQCNLSSLVGDLGKNEFKLAAEMVNKGAVSFLASDAHRLSYRNTDINGMIDYIKRYKKKVNTDLFNKYLINNPQKILENSDIEVPEFPKLEKHFFL